MNKLQKLFFWCVLTQVIAVSAFAQAVNGTIVGTVSDATGAVLAAAKVTLLEVNTGVTHTGQANSAGFYNFPDLPPGTYNVTVEMPGFKKATKAGVVLETNTSPRVDLMMTPGDVTETIEVSANAAILQTERSDTGRSMDATLVEELPLGVNRNFQSLLELVPGTMEQTFQHSQFFNATSSTQTNINGQPRMGNNFQIEGIDNNQRTGLLQILITPAEAIQQVSVSTTNHDPELGRATGGVTNVMIKSGTNQYHGSAYEFLQNSAFNARSFFNPTIGHIAYNYVGGNVGGPIKHNKLFFFANYLRIIDREANTNQTNVPSNEFRQGDLSGDPGHPVYDPATGNQDGSGMNRIPFAGNIIPQTRINPIAKKILAFLPPTNEPVIPTSQTNDYFALLPARKTTDQVDSKIDWTITEKNRLSGRFSFQRPVIFQAPEFGDAGGPAQGGFEANGRQKTYSTGLNFNRIISPTLLTEIRVGVAHYHNDAFPSDYGKPDTTNLGIPGVNLSEFTSGMVGINIGGYSAPLIGYSASVPWRRAEANIDLVNSWTKTLRNHVIKWGVDVRRVRDDLLQDQTYSPRGVMYFGTGQTALVRSCTGVSCSTSSTGLANDMASFLLDLPYQIGRDINTYFPALRQWQVFSYIADNWQISPKFTVNIGVRWEIYTAPTPRFKGGFSNYDPSTNNLLVAGYGDNPMNLNFNTRYGYFAPRIGLAYRLTEKTVIRTGFGISYTPFPDNSWMYNYPVRANNLYAQAKGSTDTYGPAILPDGRLASFENGFPAPIAVPIPQNGIMPNPDPTTQQLYVPTNYRNSYIEAWNFAIQRQLPMKFTIDAAYVGSHGVDTPANVNLNAGQIIGAGSAGQPYFVKYGITNSVQQLFQGFSSTYNSLQVKFDRRFSNGFSLTTAFTWQKAMAFQTGDDGGLYYYAGQGLRRNYAHADYDRKLNYIQSYLYQLPFGRGKKFLSSGIGSKILGGWQLGGVLSFRTGKFMSFTGNNSLNLGSGGNTTLEQVAPVEVLGGIGAGHPWFSTSSFVRTPTNTQGNTGRNIFEGPRLFALNSNLSRIVVLNENRGLKLQLRLESFNVTNTAQFGQPNTGFGSNFGFITTTLGSGTGVNGTGGGRSVQIAAKLMF
jgi:Carboxypeptidase regulatory-like domain